MSIFTQLSKFTGTYTAVLLVSITTVFSAHADILTEPFVVNNYTESGQVILDVDKGANGDSIIIWTDYGRGGFVFMQRYDKYGLPLQKEEWFLGLGIAEVAMDGGGNFVVVKTLNDSSGDGVFATIYNRAGNIIVPEFIVNTTQSGKQLWPHVDMNGSGDIVFSWTGNQTGIQAVYAKRYDRNGNALSGDVMLSNPVKDKQQALGVVIDDNANSAVAWHDSNLVASRNIDVRVRRINSLGFPQGQDVRVNTYKKGIQVGGAIAMDARGNFIVIWTSYEQDNDDWDIYGQRFNAAGARLGTEFRVNDITAGTQEIADVAMGATGEFVVVWQHQVDIESTVYAREYRADGMAKSKQFAVSKPLTNSNWFPKAGMANHGDYLVSWTHVSGSFHDSSEVYASRSIPTLDNGVTISGISGASGSWQYYKLDVPPGFSWLQFVIWNGTGDADLYIKKGGLPTVNNWDFRPWWVGSFEYVQAPLPAAAEWYIGINGYQGFSGLNLNAVYY